MKVILIDGNSLLFRAYYATAYTGTTNIMRRKDGFPTNAIYSLTNIMQKIITTEKPDYGFVAFDTSKPTFRHQQYEAYKAGRAETPQELKDQFLPARELMRKLGFFVCEQEGYEADDLIGTVSKLAPSDAEVRIYSGDKDLLQLISKNCTVCLTKKGVTDIKCMTESVLKEEMNITPSQIVDLKGLMGDKSDNIPGISGIGEKTALKFLETYGNLETIVEADIGGKIGEKIKQEKEIGLMSKKLATINTSVPVTFTFEDLKYNGYSVDLGAFLQEYEMFSLFKKMPLKKEEISIDYNFVNTIDESFYHEPFSIVLELNGDNYHKDELIGLGLSNSKSSIFIKIEDLLKNREFINVLEDENIEKFGFDNKKIICGLNRYNIKIKGLKNDFLIATYLLNSSIKDEPFFVFNFYGKIIPYKSDIYARHTYDINKVASYGCVQSSLIHELKNKVIDLLKEKQLFDLYNEIEIPLNFILANMEMDGVLIDKTFLQDKSTEYNKILGVLEKEIYALAETEFNINSPSQTADILFDVLKLPSNRKRSTSAEELEFLSSFHPIVGKILEFRKYSKLLTVYADGLQDFVLSDARIHTIYNQALTTTGRLSSKEPNLQNIAVRSEEGKQIRKAFIAKPGYKLVSFDYSQIELRVLASVANVSSLIDAFNNNIDIHSLTASKIFNVPLDDVNKELRARAKTVNFGIVYGMSEFGLANEIGCSFKEAKEFIDKYLQTYPEINEYRNEKYAECKEKGYVKTLYNRIRYINEINSSNYNERELGKRLAINTPIQGSAADIMKIAMIKVDKVINENNLDCKMLLQVHDEIVCEINESQLDRIVPLIKNTLEDFSLKVKLRADYNIGDSWLED